ncbi:MAG: DUF4011 domain-containing protein [Cytophagales bacterium]|nr:DUF4011 domain-containing protein [Cytophagales bacterium]
MQKILQSYLRRLTNLSGNNRSLLLLRLISDQFMDLHDLNFSLDKPSFKLVEELISKEKKIPLCAEMDSRDASSNVLSRRLKKIQRIDNFIFEERGAKDLYVGWPFVRGKFADGTMVRCPLIFFPVELQKEDNTWFLIRRKEVNTTLNKTFLLAYSYYNEVTLDEELIEQVVDDYDKESTPFRTQLYQLLKNSKVEINFNSDNFTDELKLFKNFKKNELDQEERPGKLKMFPEAVLGIFPQAGSYLVPDYLHLLEKEEHEDMEDFFSKAIQDEDKRYSDRVREENTFTPFRMDAFQEHALAQVKRGQSLVIQGPPGSGKSQLISNMISDFIARGKNVLLVCQKRAALDVVWERLKTKELHDFIGLVHDFKNDRKSIFDQIANQIESLDEYKSKNSSLDVILLEREFQQASRRIDKVTEELDEFKEALFDDQECGKSVKELYLISSPNRTSVTLNQEYRSFSYDKAVEFNQNFKRFLDYHERFEGQENFWAEGNSFSHFGASDFTRMKEILGELQGFQKMIDERATTFTKQKVDFETVAYFLTKREKFSNLIEVLSDEKVFHFFQTIIGNPPKKPLDVLNRLEQGVIPCFKGSGPEISLPYDQLGRFQEALEAAIKARSNFFSWIKWKLTSEDKVFITRVLVANELKSNKEGFNVLLERIDNRLNFEHYFSEIQQSKWMIDFPTYMRKIDVQTWFFTTKEAANAFEIRNTIRSLPEYISAPEYELHDYLERVRSLIKLLDEVPQQIQLWSRYISEGQLRSLMMGKQKPKEAGKLLARDFDALLEFHKLRDGFASAETSTIQKLLENYSSKEECLKVFENSLALAWIDHIESKYPVLRDVSSQRLDHLTSELQEAIWDKRKVSQEILILKSRERTYSDVEYNRLNNRVTYRDLHHQVTKKRRIWPIRRVVSDYHEELFQLLPCWLTSPESASAIFPMEQIFDLVIFDEASQCFSERGLPAMYRGKQIVVAGDDKQLKPNDLYRVRWDEESDEDIPDLEVDSLLDLVKKYVPEIALQGHYRSRSLELIEFSNEHFYKGKLKMLPHFEVINRATPAIHFDRVKGVWEDNINELEAKRVAEIVHRILNETPSKTIGVVTFNTKQQGHVLDVLEEYSAKKGILLPDHLFVKNIENVQGDERDVIIFSTAYAPDKKGKLRLQFGTLNQEGGENRLNVAITRAKEEVYLVCSVRPSELKTADTKNPGPKVLKEYLEYADQVSKKKWKPAAHTESSHSPEWYLRNQLPELMASSGTELEKNLPFADLTVTDKNGYKGLVLTDDELFHDNLSAKQSHAYQVFHLAEKKWPNIRLYSREYWMSPEHTEGKLKKFIGRVEE